MRRTSWTAIGAGAAYFAIVFAAGFALGALRTLVTTPRLGAATAVLLELPVILGVSWLACRWLVVRLGVPAALGVRALMVGTAFTLTMAGEMAVSTAVLGRTAAEHFASYADPLALLGLAAQLVFAAMPLWVRRRLPS